MADLRDQPSPYSEALATAQADAARCARALEQTQAELAKLRGAVRRYQKAVENKDMLHLTGGNTARVLLEIVKAERALDALLPKEST